MIYVISCKTFMGAKPLHIIFAGIDGFIKPYDGIRYLVLFGSELFDAIYNRTTYLISKKSVLQIVLLLIFQESELIHVVLY